MQCAVCSVQCFDLFRSRTAHRMTTPGDPAVTTPPPGAGGAGCNSTSLLEQAKGRYTLRFSVKRTEPDVESVFLSKGGSLGAAAARGDVDFALTHSKTAVRRLVTDRLVTDMEIEIPEELVTNSEILAKREQFAAQLEGSGKAVGPVLFLPDRARLNMTASRWGASINGTLVGSLSGQGSVTLQELFSESQDLVAFLKAQQQNEPTNASDAPDAPDAPDASATTGDEAKGAPPMDVLSMLIDALPVRPKVRVPVNFEQVPLAYSNWSAHQSVVAIYDPKVYRKCSDGSFSGPISIAFVKNVAEDAQIAKVEPVMQGIYNASWDVCGKVVYEPSKNLTKSVMRVPCGYNGSGYAPAAAVNDTPPSYPDATLEVIVKACLESECSDAEMAIIHNELAVSPDPELALQFAGVMASAMSAFNAYTMCYRVDGTPVVEPTGIRMVQSESWRAEPVRSILHADDCDGSACSAISVVKRATEIANTEGANLPHLRALGNSLGAHYVFGTSVLAANAGHADAANEHTEQIAGHAIALAIPKVSFLLALERGGAGNIQGAPVVAVKDREAVAEARFDALYPEALRAKIAKRLAPDAEQPFASYTNLKWSKYARRATGFQPLSMEGTTLASSCLYKHDHAERERRKAAYAKDKEVATRLAPNITRTHKTLDSGEKGTHAFYKALVELSISMTHPLFTHKALRTLGVASPHYRFIRPREDEPMERAGASPEDLALGNFALMPLWEVNKTDGALLDKAHAEAAANTLPMRQEPLTLDEHDVKCLEASESALRTLHAQLSGPKAKDNHGGCENGQDADQTHHCTRHILSFAAMVGNSAAINTFVETVAELKDVTGSVRGLEKDGVLQGIAVDRNSTQRGRMVIIELQVPLGDEYADQLLP